VRSIATSNGRGSTPERAPTDAAAATPTSPRTPTNDEGSTPTDHALCADTDVEPGAAIELLIGVARATSDMAAEQTSDRPRAILYHLAADALDAVDELEA
jgi:hypothetical protein